MTDYNDVPRNLTEFCALCSAPEPDGTPATVQVTLGGKGKKRVIDIPVVICASCKQRVLEKWETKGKR